MAVLTWACGSSKPANVAGRWTLEENGQSAQLLLTQDTSTGRVSGTFAALGKRIAVSGRVDASALLLETPPDPGATAAPGKMVGVVSGEQMLLTIEQPNQDPVILSLARQPGSAASSSALTAANKPATASQPTAVESPSFTPSQPADFIGSWESVSDDGTKTETAELKLADGVVTGILRSLERGYYSGRVTVKAEVAVQGTPRAGGLDLQAWDAQSGSVDHAVAGRAVRRGDYLVLQIGNGETGYARPGVPVVRSAEGSTSAAALAQAVAGKIYSASTRASGRGAFVGDRVRLALCADRSIAFDVSDLATTGGADAVDAGDATSRRGEWSVVLLAGEPVVRAHWNGTGSSFSLTRYFRVQPNADGSAARIDGTNLPVTGSC